MHFSPAFIAAAAIFLLPAVRADAEDAEAVVAAVIDRPLFVPSEIKAPFLEQFTDDWALRWKPSTAKKEEKSDEEWQYIGKWEVEEPTVFKGIKGDKGLVLKDKAAHHAISAKFPAKVDPKGKTLVIQYEVKLQEGLQCGGAYMKLLQDTKALGTEEFSNATPYVIMFGPDKCGSTNKVHFIFRHKNPKTGEYEEKHLEYPPSVRNEKTTSLYTLVVRPDNSFEIRINGEPKANGNLLTSFDPAVNPPTEIDDPTDTKPEDWVDMAQIHDPHAVKPEDWDEDAPAEIVDASATMPSDWMVDEPLMVPDPDAVKPEDWDDDEDGDWVPPSVPNPKCSEASGCGPWEPPYITNPDYKGKWHAPMIDNPAYKGEWVRRKMKNVDYFEDKNPANFEPIGGIGFELWTMQEGILFDNIYVGHSVEDAEQLKRETFDIKFPIEEKEEDAETAKATPPKPSGTPRPPVELKFGDNPVQYIRERVDLFMTFAKTDPLDAVKYVPEVAAGFGVLALSFIFLIASALGIGAKSPAVQDAAKKARDAAIDSKDRAAEAIATGADKAQDEIKKRATRSSGPAAE